LLIAAAGLILSLPQRVLNTDEATAPYGNGRIGSIAFKDESVQPVSMPALLEVPERALQLLSLGIPLLAASWLASRVSA